MDLFFLLNMAYAVLHNDDVTNGFGFKWPDQYNAFIECLQQTHATNTQCSIVEKKKEEEGGCILLLNNILTSFVLNEFTKPRSDYMRRYVVMQALGNLHK
jgi:hypothetical protein